MKSKEKKPGGLWLALGVLLGYYSFMNLDGVQRVYNLLFHRGPSILLPYLQNFPYLISYLVMPFLAAVFLLIGLIMRLKGPKERSKEIHTHDRIETVSYNVNETEAEHYKKQLDGFLKAGIIEREEYNILIKRYGK